MGRALLALFAVWLLTTGSSCSATVNNGQATIAASDAAAAAGVAGYLVGMTIYCMVETEECFPDEEALQAQAEAYERARSTYTAGLRRHQNGDPTGLEWICRSAQQGYARAQYYYGSYLWRQGPDRQADSLAWLRRAAAQGLPEADVLLRQVAGGPLPAEAQDTAPPPAAACAAATA